VNSFWLLGTLSGHARGKILSDVLATSAAHVLPPGSGMCFAFGSDFQDQEEEIRREWVRWCELAGRTLLLVPPFAIAECQTPISWRIYRPQRVETDSIKLAKLLAPEVRYELAGQLQVATDVGGQWKSGGINTAFYRKHPHSGLFAITCLPLWSLTVLDHRDALREWVTALNDLAGVPSTAEESTAIEEFHPAKDHFAMMLHLCGGNYRSRDEAIKTLTKSPVLMMPEPAARQCLEQLESAGFSSGGALTVEGRDILFASPYAAYAEALEATRK
jgi:hypothetical protein